MTTLILHSANLDPTLPCGSLIALEESLKANITYIEVDLIPLKNGDFALLHDPQLEHTTNAKGSVSDFTAQEVKVISYKNSPFKLGTLSQAVQLLENYPVSGFLQLDLKPYAPLTPAILQNLVNLIKPVEDSILVSSVADWAIRLLKKLAPNLKLGFDPLLYLDLVGKETREEGVPPFRVGAFGYLDDHPLAAQRWGPLKDYFEARAEALLQQVPTDVTWFINAQLLDEALQAGFNWIQYLQNQGNLVDAWTLDMDRSALAMRMKQAGVNFITTNQLVELDKILMK